LIAVGRLGQYIKENVKGVGEWWSQGVEAVFGGEAVVWDEKRNLE
jgi:hypothetical protein